MRRLSLAAARRVAITAQGLGAPRLPRVTTATLNRAIRRMGVLQLDTVNVFERSHYLPLLARLGPYDRGVLDRLLHHESNATRLGAYTEYTAHEAAILPVTDWPLWAWHRARPDSARTQAWLAEHRGLLDEVRAEFAERGPLRIRDLDHPANVSLGGGWWNKNQVHAAAVHLFRRGELVTVGRQRFERILGLAEQTLPPHAQHALSREESVRELVRRAAVAHGVGTLADLADYPRLPVADARQAVDALVQAGELEPVTVDGWPQQAYFAVGQRVPRSVSTVALLSPFDPLVWFRPRALRLFDFHYRISIYTPAAQRKHGYYVLPVLVDDEIVGRVDLKSDRQAGLLRVQHAHVEPPAAARAAALARRVAPVLQEAAAWQGLSEVSVTGAGTWATDLARVL